MNSLRIIIPLGLGLTAGIINFLVVRGMAAPIELTAVRNDTKAGTELKPDQLTKVLVRGDSPQILRSAVPWAERGILLRRRVNRALAAGEVIMFADVRTEGGEDIQTLLRPGEASFTFSVRQSRIALGLRVGDSVGIVVADSSVEEDPDSMEKGGRRIIGPVRVIALGERPDPFRLAGGADDFRKISVAVPVSARNELTTAGQSLDAALAPGPGGDKRGRILAVEFFRPTGGR